jgi:hypothetical protein
MVDPITGATSNAAALQTTSARFRAVTDAVAKELGMSTDDLTAAMRSGESLDDLAAGKGVSHDDLVATIKQALQSTAGTTDPTALDQLAARIAAAKPHHHHHHHHVAAGAAGANATTGTTGVSGADGADDGGGLGQRVDTRA